ncbi:E3 ubiquitin-protein ligase BRE1A-like [Achroia grisella]|uniref:E3 ubiquitin-protein ligase BRE1A-like n=1 Tax=Achroia grisella TaxID=688607 RepID=UPI0027D290FE|nr:E3 ubiquitin-protein ligase BRE1A-like [Achroia grisella]
MFGLRTPPRIPRRASAATPPEPAANTSVRRSIGEIEAKIAPKSATKSRTEEARLCNNKAKSNLALFKNLRRDLKDDTAAQVEKLYRLVKESEAELEKLKVERRKEKGTSPEKEKEAEKNKEEEEKNKEKGEIEKKMEEIMDGIRENNRILRENAERMEEIQREAKESREKEQEARAMHATYAEATATGKGRRTEERKTLHSVVVASKDEEDSAEVVLEKIRETVDAKEGWVRVERVRKAKDRKVIVGCAGEADKAKIRERLRSAGKGLVVEDVKNRDPLLVLRDVLKVHSDADVLKALRNQNGAVFRGLGKEEDRVAVKYRKRARNQHTTHIVLEVSPAVWKRALEEDRLRIDLQRVRVDDQSPLVQCTRCLAYGHSKRFCKEHADLCSYCGGLHQKNECPDWRAGATPSCINCHRSKAEDTGHTAFNDECPVRRRWDSLARASVAYC